jgi:RNA polymerase-binding transcription factor DksA
MDLESIKTRLEKEEDSLQGELSVLKKEDPYLSSDRVSSLTLDDDLIETEGHDRIVGTRLELKQRLEEVKEALTKLRRGDYGSCENCGKAISKERLLALPTAKFCLDCEAKRSRSL